MVHHTEHYDRNQTGWEPSYNRGLHGPGFESGCHTLSGQAGSCLHRRAPPVMKHSLRWHVDDTTQPVLKQETQLHPSTFLGKASSSLSQRTSAF